MKKFQFLSNENWTKNFVKMKDFVKMRYKIASKYIKIRNEI